MSLYLLYFHVVFFKNGGRERERERKREERERIPSILGRREESIA
jgi:bisphosphoglycerate-independent phosphoglycerate mutase (AlkP superfamily)